MTSKLHKYVVAILLLWSSTTTLAQDAGAEPSLMTYDLATTAMVAAEAFARQQGWNVTILITD
jgi:hypothetical protein